MKHCYVFILHLQSLAYARRIADALIALQQHGSSEYIGWELRFSCALPCIVEKLQMITSEMEADLEIWKQGTEQQRDQFYELNYFTSQQLLLLREKLGRLKNDTLREVNPEAMTLLQSISREVYPQVVREQVVTVTTMLEEHKRVARGPPPDQVEEEQRMEHVVEETSSLLKDILKTERSKNAARLSQLGDAKLSDEKQSILVNLKENFGYSKELILLAFEHCDNPEDENEIAEWCTDNQDLYQSEEAGGGEAEEEEGEEEEYIVVETHDDRKVKQTEEEKDHQEKMELPAAKLVKEMKPGLPKLVVKERTVVDIDHPVVQELLSLDYPLEQCLDAAEQYPNDPDAAFTFLQQSGQQGELFKESLKDDVLVVGNADDLSLQFNSSEVPPLDEGGFNRQLGQESAGR